MKCSRCNGEARFRIPYAGLNLCEEHFLEFVDSKVKREFREQVRFKKGDRIVVAVSGGKDSMHLLYQVHKIFGEWRDFEIIAVTVDEGIGDFRVKCAELAREYSKELGIEHRTITFRDYIGITTDDVAKVDKELKPCTYCGVFRRKVLNMFAKEMNADYVLLGLNLDDFAQSIVMNVTRGDVARLARLAPHTRRVEGFVPRIVPLRRVLEEEIRTYNEIAGIPYMHGRCPYASLAIRDVYREFLNNLEKRDPAVKFSTLNFFEKIKGYVEEDVGRELRPCRICGEPTIGEVCKACELKMRYEKLKDQV